MQRPATSEYKSYFQRYIDLVPEGDIVDIMKQNAIDTKTFFEGIPEDKHDYSYAPGKWTLKDVLMHIMDTERGMSYRALVAARGINIRGSIRWKKTCMLPTLTLRAGQWKTC